jgi:uncharacterized membrane protein YgcG
MVALTLCYSARVFATDLPARPTQRFSDTASFVPSSEIAELNVRLIEFARRTGIDYYVYVIASLHDEPDESFVKRCLDHWQLGPNGLAMFVFVTERRTRMQTWGSTESLLSESDLQHLIDHVVNPRFRNGDRVGGISNSIDTLSSVLAVRKTEREHQTQIASQAAAFLKRYNIKQVVTAAQLTINPFVYQGQVVAIYGEFNQMNTSTRALFVAEGKSFLVSNVPSARFVVPRAMVLLAARVEGNIETNVPQRGSAVVPTYHSLGMFSARNNSAQIIRSP